MLIPIVLALCSWLPETVHVERVDGSTRAVELDSLSPADLGAGDVISVRFLREAAPASETAGGEVAAGLECVVTLLGGDRIAGVVRGGVDETLALLLAGAVSLPVGIEELDHFVFPARVPSGRALSHAELGDRLYVRRGTELDRVDGTFLAFRQDGVRFEADELEGSKTFAWTEVAALFVEALGGGPEEPADGARTPVAIDLVDGSRLRGGLTALGDDACTVELGSGQSVALPLGLVRELWRDDGTVAFLSDLEPAEARAGSIFGDEFGMRWPHRVDRAVSGDLLRSGGRTYARGLGVHAGSRLRWELDGGWRTLRGRVAIDDSVLGLPGADRASVEFRIWVDGTPGEDEPTWRSGPIGAGELPLAIEGLDLSGARSLTLEVDPAANYSVGDRSNWLRMLLVRG